MLGRGHAKVKRWICDPNPLTQSEALPREDEEPRGDEKRQKITKLVKFNENSSNFMKFL